MLPYLLLVLCVGVSPINSTLLTKVYICKFLLIMSKSLIKINSYLPLCGVFVRWKSAPCLLVLKKSKKFEKKSRELLLFRKKLYLCNSSLLKGTKEQLKHYKGMKKIFVIVSTFEGNEFPVVALTTRKKAERQLLLLDGFTDDAKHKIVELNLY